MTLHEKGNLLLIRETFPDCLFVWFLSLVLSYEIPTFCHPTSIHNPLLEVHRYLYEVFWNLKTLRDFWYLDQVTGVRLLVSPNDFSFIYYRPVRPENSRERGFLPRRWNTVRRITRGHYGSLYSDKYLGDRQRLFRNVQRSRKKMRKGNEEVVIIMKAGFT